MSGIGKISRKYRSFKYKSNLVTTNSMGLWTYVGYNHEIVITMNIYEVKLHFVGTQSGVKFVCYNREFVINLIVITEFD